MTQIVGKKSQVMDGPSMWDLMLALFDGDSNHRRNVRFIILADESRPIIEKISLNLTVNSVERVPDSNWAISASDQVHSYRIVYSTESRLGRIEIV